MYEGFLASSRFAINSEGDLFLEEVRYTDRNKTRELIEKKVPSGEESIAKTPYCHISHIFAERSGALYAEIDDPSDPYSPKTMISREADCSMFCEVDVDDQKNVMAAWIDVHEDILYAAYKPFKKPWTPFVKIEITSSKLTGRSVPFKIVHGAGKFFIVWQKEQNGFYYSVRGITFSTTDEKWSEYDFRCDLSRFYH